MSDYVSAALRNAAAMRAQKRCEYCLLHEDDTLLSHEPDHIIACKHGGETINENLAWACFLCNRFKGSDLSSVDPNTREIERLFNPRKERWIDHFELNQNGIVTGTTPHGRVTVFLLRINLRENVETRELLIRGGRFDDVIRTL